MCGIYHTIAFYSTPLCFILAPRGGGRHHHSLCSKNEAITQRSRRYPPASTEGSLLILGSVIVVETEQRISDDFPSPNLILFSSYSILRFGFRLVPFFFGSVSSKEASTNYDGNCRFARGIYGPLPLWASAGQVLGRSQSLGSVGLRLFGLPHASERAPGRPQGSLST